MKWLTHLGNTNDTLQKILDAANDSIIGFDEQRKIQYANLAAEQLFAYSQHEFQHLEIDRIFPQIKMDIKNPNLTQHGLKGQTKDGSTFDAEVSVKIISGEEHQVYIFIVRDITHHQWMENQLHKREHQLRTFLNGSEVLIWWMNAEGVPFLFNDAWLNFMGSTLNQALNLDWNGENIHPDDRARCLETYHCGLLKQIPFRHEYRHRNKEGEYRWVLESGTPQFGPDNQYHGFIGTAVDITVHRHIEDKLFEEKELLKITLKSIGDGVVTTDTKGIIEYLNPVAEQLLGWPSSEAIGRSVREVLILVNEDDRQSSPNPVIDCLKDRRVIHFGDHKILLSRSGCEYAIQDSAAPIIGRNGRLLGAIMVFSDATDERRMVKKIAYQASHDVLTELVNRREFEQRLQRILESARKNGSNHALCYLDLDQFKIVNDTCGHAVGDKLLRQISALLLKCIRSRDTLGRLGDDEFGIIMEHCTVEQAERAAELIREAIEAFHFTWKDKVFEIRVSVGLVAITELDLSTDDLMIKADTACYAAKRAGRNQTHTYQADDIEVTKQQSEMNWVSRINGALEDNRFCLYFQPIRSLKNPERLHYEILLRLYDDNGGVILPGAFMPAAEHFGLIQKIDCWVIQKAFRWLASNPQHVERLHLCAINLSGYSLGNQEVLTCILKQLDETQIPPEKICFEITETAAIDNLASATQFIDALRKKGCRFALDDFGSGLASFAYLKILPVDYLKIDGIFVQHMINDKTDLAMVKSINEIGHVMGKQTVAEFVEDDETLDVLGTIGVDFVQGYAIERPIPLQEMNTWYKAFFAQPPEQIGSIH